MHIKDLLKINYFLRGELDIFAEYKFQDSSIKKIDNKNKYPLAFFFLALIIIINSNIPPYEVTPSLKLIETPFGTISLTRFLLLICLFLFMILLLFNYKKCIRLNSNDCCMYLLIVIALLNHNDSASLMYFYAIIVGSYIIGKISGFLNYGDGLLKIIVFASLIQIVIVLYSTFISEINFNTVEGRDLFLNFNSKIGVNGPKRAVGSIGHPVVLGALLLPSAIYWLNMLLCQQKKKAKIIAAILLAITLFCIFLTYSRGTWLSFIIIMIYMLFKNKMIKRVKTWFSICIVIIAFFMSPYGDMVLQRITVLNNFSDGSVSHRLYMYYWSFNQLIENPKTFFFGNGIGSTKYLLLNNPPPDFFLVVDNCYLTFLVDSGILGFSLLIYILLKSIKTKQTNDSNIINYMIAALSLNAFTFDLYYWDQLGVLLWILIGYKSSNFGSFNKLN